MAAKKAPAKKAAAKKAPAKKAPAKKASARKRAPAKKATRSQFKNFICNVVPSKDTEQDWLLADSIASGAIGAPAALPTSVDLRAPWWTINNQENTGSCVGWATADGVTRYHMVKANKVTKQQLLSPRYIWMASKETDSITNRPESFIEGAASESSASGKPYSVKCGDSAAVPSATWLRDELARFRTKKGE